MTAPRTPEQELADSRHPERVREMFNAISPTYDLLNHLLSFGLDLRWRAFAARTLMEPGTASVLDVCGGTGDLAMALSRQAAVVGVRAQIVSTDFASAMVRRAAEKTRRALSPFRVATADTMCLPFRDNSFDLVTAAFGIRNVHDLHGALLELKRVCRPGGRIGILEFAMPQSPLLGTIYRAYFHKVLPCVGAWVSRNRAYSYLPASVELFPAAREFGRLLEEVNEAGVTQHRLTFGAVYLHVARVAK